MWEVNLREDEYNKLQKKIADYHKEEIADIKAVIKDIRQLLDNGEYFNLEQTTANLLLLLSIMEEEILPLVENAFQDTEQYVDTIITSFNNIDTLC